MSVTIPIKVNVGVRSDHINAFNFDTLSELQRLYIVVLSVEHLFEKTIITKNLRRTLLW